MKQVDISNMQLLTRTLLQFFSAPYLSCFTKWIDMCWVISIWKNMSQLRITIDVEELWTSQSTWEHEI